MSENSIPDLWDLHNYGASLYAYIANWVYVNVGAYTGALRNCVTNAEGSDPLDLYGRIAVTPQGIPADVNVGLFLYSGKDRTTTGPVTEVKPRRVGVDLGVLYSVGDLGLELNGVYVSGRDSSPSNPDFKHSGYNLLASLYWKYKVGVSLLYGEYRYKSDNPLTADDESGVRRRETTLHLSYLLRPNVRLGAEYSTYDVSPGEDTNRTTLTLDFSF